MLKYSIAAIALVAGSSLAIAEPGNNAGAAGGPAGGGAAMEHSGGSMKGGATEGNGGPGASMRGSDMQGGASERSSAGEGRLNKSAAEDRSGKLNSEKSEKNASSRDRDEGSLKERQASDKDRGDLKSGDRSDRLNKSADRDRDRNSSDRLNDKSRNDRSSTGASEGTAGNERGKTGELSGVSGEQRTKVISAFGSHRVSPARDIGVAVNVGVRIPRSVHFYPIPEEIVTIVPDYRGYEYFMVDDSHVAIVDPETLEVVDIIVIA